LLFACLIHDSAAFEAAPTGAPLKEIFDSVGTGVVAIGLDGRLTYVNSAAERLLGCHADELMKEWATTEILAPGEGARLVAEMEKLCGIERPPEKTAAGRMAAYLNCVRMLPPSRVPSFEVQLRRKDGVLIPITLHISALRDGDGAITGLVAVGVDQASTLHQEQALRESQERYRDLFENSNEMIATLSPAGKFLYANPAWKRCFGLENAALWLSIRLMSFSVPPAASRWPISSAAPWMANRWTEPRCATTQPTAACWNWN
jgi:PAS domain-containing protein